MSGCDFQCTRRPWRVAQLSSRGRGFCSFLGRLGGGCGVRRCGSKSPRPPSSKGQKRLCEGAKSEGSESVRSRAKAFARRGQTVRSKGGEGVRSQAARLESSRPVQSHRFGNPVIRFWGTGPPACRSSPPVSGSSPLVSQSSPLVSGSSPLVSESSPLVSQSSPLVSGSSPLVSRSGPLVSRSSPLLSGSSRVVLESSRLVPGSSAPPPWLLDGSAVRRLLLDLISI